MLLHNLKRRTPFAKLGRILIKLIIKIPNPWANKQKDIELRGISKAFTWDTWYKNILHHLVQLKTFLESDYYYIWIISLFLFLFSRHDDRLSNISLWGAMMNAVQEELEIVVLLVMVMKRTCCLSRYIP